MYTSMTEKSTFLKGEIGFLERYIEKSTFSPIVGNLYLEHIF